MPNKDIRDGMIKFLGESGGLFNLSKSLRYLSKCIQDIKSMKSQNDFVRYIEQTKSDLAKSARGTNRYWELALLMELITFHFTVSS